MNRSTRAAIATALLAGLLLALRVLVTDDPLASLTQRIVDPFQSVLSDISFDDNDEPTADPSELLNSELAAENERLRAELELSETLTSEVVTARVVAKNVETYRRALMIDLGRNQGIQPDQAVINGGFLIGVTSEVLDNRAWVILVNDPDFRAAAQVGDTQTEGVVKQLSGGVILDQASPLNDDLEGQSVRTSGLGGLFPPGLLIGSVGEALGSDNAVFGSYRVTLPFNPALVDVVNVVVAP